MINHLACWGRWKQVWLTSRSTPKRFHLVATSPCEVTNCFCAPQPNIMKIQGVPVNAVMCVHEQGNTWTSDMRNTHTHTHPCTYKCSHTLSTAATYTCTHLFAWWTFIRMQNRGIIWVKQSGSWQTRSPAKLKISPNTLRDQITGSYVDLPQSN